MLKKKSTNGLIWFKLDGDIGLTEVADFIREMTKEIQYGNKVYILDISESEHIQRHAFDSLINIKNKLKLSGVRLIILCTKKLLMDILKVERVPEHFEVLNNVSLVDSYFSFSNSKQVFKN